MKFQGIICITFSLLVTVLSGSRMREYDRILQQAIDYIGDIQQNTEPENYDCQTDVKECKWLCLVKYE